MLKNLRYVENLAELRVYKYKTEKLVVLGFIRKRESNEGSEFTLRIAGDMELGPLDEKVATFVATGSPTNVLVG